MVKALTPIVFPVLFGSDPHEPWLCVWIVLLGDEAELLASGLFLLLSPELGSGAKLWLLFLLASLGFLVIFTNHPNLKYA